MQPLWYRFEENVRMQFVEAVFFFYCHIFSQYKKCSVYLTTCCDDFELKKIVSAVLLFMQHYLTALTYGTIPCNFKRF